MEQNIIGGVLADCSRDPLTGWFRDGCCRTDDHDRGVHTVCVRLTRDFLEFSARRGNDLITPRPELGFPGLKPGDQWCLCASRWLEAYNANVAPGVVVNATHAATLSIVPLDVLLDHALDAN